MASQGRPRSRHLFERIAQRAAELTGGSGAFILAVAVIAAWLISGPLFGFSNTWQLVINSTTTIITFLMVFLIQRSQNKDALAVQLKLNELVAAMKGASNRLIDIEDLSERDLALLHNHYRKLAKMAKHDHDLASSHSVEEAQQRHARKSSAR